ncbi:MAG: hypothetical protein U5K56_13230 [Halioglobus sp.]|nr:hypothetical protein [Halioglobus sp.]
MNEKREQCVQLELPGEVLSRLLREHSLVASEVRCLNQASRRTIRQALLHSLKNNAE